MAAVADKVKSIIVEQLGVDEEEVTPEASFVDDLGADSLDTVELVMAFEEEFGIEIPDEDAEKITRVKEAVEYIEGARQEQEVACPAASSRAGPAAARRRGRSCARRGVSTAGTQARPAVGTRRIGGSLSRRVVVTGIGLLSPLGIGTEANWQGLRAGRSGVARITHFDATNFAAQIAGEVKGFDPLQFVEKKEVKKIDVFIQYAIAASQFAMDDSGLKITPAIANRVGVFIASGIGGFSTIEREHQALLEGGPRQDLAVLHPCRDHQPGRRARLDPLRRQGPEPGHLPPPAPPRRTRSARPPT